MGRELTDTQGRLPSWALVNARQNEELRTRELVEKLEEAERLMMSIDDFGWRATLDDDAPIALALRPRDIADMESILTVAPALDLERVRKTIAAFSEALETRDFSAEFEQIAKRVKPDP